MNKWLKRGGLVVLGVVGVAATAIVAGAQLGERKAHRHIDIPVQGVAFRSDTASVERGQYLYRSRGCGDCHGSQTAKAQESHSAD